MSGPSRKALVGCVVLAAAVAVGAPVATTLLHHRTPSGSTQQPVAAVTTALVTRATLTSRSVVTGALTYEGNYDATAMTGGVLTGAARVGTTVTRGQSLFSVAQRPTMLLYGTVPAWRDYTTTSAPGVDIAELAGNLVAMGYLGAGDIGTRPSGAITAAVKSWQGHLKLAENGRLRLGDVAFLPGPARVTDVSQAVGTQVAAGTALLTATSTTLGASVALDPATAASLQTGDPVLVTTPDGVRRNALIAQVSTVAGATPGSGGTPTVTVPADVRFSPAWQPGRRALDQAPVQIAITVRAVPDALAVPVTALVGEPGGGYAVETVTAAGHMLLPVTPGLFDELSGLVQVSRTALSAGQRVVVASS